MKNRLKTVALLLLISISLLTLSSCYMVDINDLVGTGSGPSDTSNFVTKDELDSLLSSSDKEYSINSGDITMRSKVSLFGRFNFIVYTPPMADLLQNCDHTM